MAALSTIDSNSEMNKLTSEIFSILENNFLFGYDNPLEQKKSATGKVRILSIDGGGATDGVLAAKAILHLESSLRRKSGSTNAHIADFFDVAAGSGIGGVLAALLFTRGKDGGPLFTADEAVKFVTENGRKLCRSSKQGVLRRILRSTGNVFDQTFGDLTLKDTLKAVLIPCYDLTTGAPFVFSRADAMEMDGCDFKLSDVCAATTAVRGPTKTFSVDRRTKIAAVGGEVAMNNPTAAAITHVLYNKQEFPFCNGVDDLLVVSLGNGEPLSVDQAVSMAFGQSRTTRYVRIQANKGLLGVEKSRNDVNMSVLAEEMLKQQNVESVLFQGKKCNSTNLEKLEHFAGEIVKEKERRKTDMLPVVLLSQTTTSSSARTSSATTLSTISSS
ncbi:Acyl transferase/acyl hydrolase/lysophospholipase [Cynara cardunculus var. scolymus]|uniref:Patatin n=1 Tax=Cynara cardunculus var. scolymus TaxID=59895 RepID=A0A124SBZ4_CYNCS|nr:Acyl transferase/acyl hydrolase/lysophospholipase [Cynara cardunculus var. scolymus]